LLLIAALALLCSPAIQMLVAPRHLTVESAWVGCLLSGTVGWPLVGCRGGQWLLRFRLTVSLLRCRDVAGRTGLVEFCLSGPLPLSLVWFLSWCGLRLLAGCCGSSSLWSSKDRSFGEHNGKSCAAGSTYWYRIHWENPLL
jgi:hypothetical protein